VNHQLTASTDDDQVCARPDCEVMVADDVLVLGLVFVACPAPPCEAPAGDGRCVFVLVEGAQAECAYCTRRL